MAIRTVLELGSGCGLSCARYVVGLGAAKASSEPSAPTTTCTIATRPTLVAGLFFFHHIRSYTYMDLDLENVIRQALEDALLNGRDHMAQTVLAVQAVLDARPDMTATEALAAVILVQQE